MTRQILKAYAVLSAVLGLVLSASSILAQNSAGVTSQDPSRDGAFERRLTQILPRGRQTELPVKPTQASPARPDLASRTLRGRVQAAPRQKAAPALAVAVERYVFGRMDLATDAITFSSRDRSFSDWWAAEHRHRQLGRGDVSVVLANPDGTFQPA